MLTPGEYEGPLTVDRPYVIDGGRSTLWANSGPVLIVSAPNVTVKNLRIEVTGTPADSEGRIAIKTSDRYTRLENIEVHGDVVGLPQEAKSWELPGIISLGEFAANTENTFTVSLEVSVAAELDSMVKDLRISPTHLTAGRNSLTFTTDELRNNTILYGEIAEARGAQRRRAVQRPGFYYEDSERGHLRHPWDVRRRADRHFENPRAAAVHGAFRPRRQ